MPSHASSFRIALVLTPSFNAMATIAFVDPFRAANYLDGRPFYRWCFLSSAGGLLQASNGMEIQTGPLDDRADGPLDLGVISSSWTPEAQYSDRKLLGAIRVWARQGVKLCGLDTGGFLLARAGQLEGRRAAVHYEHLDAFQELYPNVLVADEMFVIDGNVMTCCGGVASADLALQLIRTHRGDALANAAARYIFHQRLRGPAELQKPTGYEPLGGFTPAKLREAIFLMERHLDDPLPIPKVAERIGISQRQLERLFRDCTRASPVQYYRDVRLDHSRALLTQTDMSVLEVAVACGFNSPEHFSRAYRRRFKLSPRRDRVEGRVPFEFRAWPMHPRAG